MDIEIRIEEALEYMHNDTDHALELFNLILEEQPENINALNGKGSALMKLHKNKKALEVFDYSLSIEENSSAYLNKGIISKNNKDYKNALKYFDKALEYNPRLTSIVSILKNEIIETVNLESEDLDSLYDFSNETNSLIKEAINYRSQNRIWDCLDCLEKAIEEDPTCKNSVNDLIKKVKKTLHKEFLYPKTNSTNNPSTSSKDKNAKSKSSKTSPKNNEKMRKLNKLKNMTYRSIIIENNPRKTLSLTDKILEINENDLEGLNFKGIAYFSLDEYEKAIECFDMALNIDKDYAYAMFNKGLVLRRMRLYDKSLKCFDKALKTPTFFNKIKPYQEEVLNKLKQSS